MIPVVALVGCLSVGKSTLLNHLTRTHDTLATDFSGLTHDRKYGRAEVEDRGFICINTDGTDGTEKGAGTWTAEQLLSAIEEADVVLFMVDAHADLMPANITIAKRLRSHEKSTFLMTNKTDGIDVDQAMTDFWSLGLGGIYPIAVSHGRGVTSLLGQALLPWVDEISPQEEMDEDAEYQAKFEVEQNGGVEEGSEDDLNPQDLPIRPTTVGRSNVGKSAPTNRTLGKDRVVVYDMPGTTRGSIYISMQRDEREYVLIDTVGVRKRGEITDVMEEFSMIKTPQATEDANAVLLVIDAREGISDQNFLLLGFIFSSDRPLVVAVNKWDGLSQEVKEQVKETLDYRLGFIDLVWVHFISALHDSGASSLFESVRRAYNSAIRRVSTATPTWIMNMAAEDHQPSLVRDHYVKLRYAHVGGYNPPVVVIHGNQVKGLPDFYKHYLMNYSHKSLDVMGTLIRIQFKEGKNPPVNKRNTLTPNQMRKRKRSTKCIKKSKQSSSPPRRVSCGRHAGKCQNLPP